MLVLYVVWGKGGGKRGRGCTGLEFHVRGFEGAGGFLLEVASFRAL